MTYFVLSMKYFVLQFLISDKGDIIWPILISVAFDATSVVVPQCNMLLCPCVYGFQQYGHQSNSCLVLCFLFAFAL